MEIIHLISLLELLIIGFMIFTSRISKKDVESFRNFSSDIRKEMLQQSKNILRLQIFDENADDYSRLEAGIEYMRLGGNHKAKNKIFEIAKNNPEAWDVVYRNNIHPEEIDSDFFKNSINSVNKLINYKQNVLL